MAVGVRRGLIWWLYRINRGELSYLPDHSIWRWTLDRDGLFVKIYDRSTRQNKEEMVVKVIVGQDQKPILFMVNEDVEIVERGKVLNVFDSEGVDYIQLPFSQLEEAPSYIKYHEYFGGRYIRPSKPEVKNAWTG